MPQLTISSEDLNGKEIHPDDKKSKMAEKQNTLRLFKHKSVKRLTLKKRGNSNSLIPVSSNSLYFFATYLYAKEY